MNDTTTARERPPIPWDDATKWEPLGLVGFATDRDTGERPPGTVRLFDVLPGDAVTDDNGAVFRKECLGPVQGAVVVSRGGRYEHHDGLTLVKPLEAADALTNAERICDEWESDDGNGNLADEIAEHAYAVVIRYDHGDRARVVWADDAAHVAQLEAACADADAGEHDGEAIETIYSVATGEPVDYHAEVDIIATVTLGGERGRHSPRGRALIDRDTAELAGKACDELAEEIVGRSHTDRNIARADVLHAAAIELQSALELLPDADPA